MTYIFLFILFFQTALLVGFYRWFIVLKEYSKSLRAWSATNQSWADEHIKLQNELMERAIALDHELTKLQGYDRKLKVYRDSLVKELAVKYFSVN